MAKLKPAFEAIALSLQEATSDPLSHSDIHNTLSDQLDDMHPGQCCVCDVFGDDQSGDVVYRQTDPKSGSAQTFKAPYAIGTTNGKRSAEIDEDSKTNVVPRTTYEEEADDEDSYNHMESERKRDKLYTVLPAYERFISKSERDSADSGSFAGKGQSFPILKPGDVMAAVRSMGRAGSGNVGTSTLKANIIRIAKKKGWTKYLPKAWQSGGTADSDASESLKFRFADEPQSMKLFESALTLEQIVLKEARADYPIKLIAPGKGSSAFYPKEVLQRDGPKVFKSGTHVYLNHPTAAEEAARPEGDVNNLAGVLTTPAEWQESGAKGPGLYARMKVFADHAQTVEEKYQHVGMSIRASGIAEAGRKHEGLPILKELTGAESVDIVTKPGADGRIFTESARTTEGEAEMTAVEVKRLVEAQVRPFREKAHKSEAREMAMGLLEAVTLPDIAKQKIVARAVESLDLSEEIDEKALGEAVVREAKLEGEYLAQITGSGRVIGMGPSPVVKPKEAKRLKEAEKELRKESVNIFEELMGDRDAAKLAVKGRVA